MKPLFKNLVLIGYRGAGKSLLAEELRKKLRLPLFSSDFLIEKQVGDLTTFIEKAGWEQFRALESEIISKLSQKGGVIIDTGGGVVERRENLVRLRKKGILIWLAVPEKILISRLKKVARPQLEAGLGLEVETRKKLSERNPLYEDFSELRLDGRKKPSKLAEEVIAYCFERKSSDKKAVSVYFNGEKMDSESFIEIKSSLRTGRFSTLLKRLKWSKKLHPSILKKRKFAKKAVSL